MMTRCLIVGCSRTKVDTPELLPAIQRYDGPAYRVIRRFLREAPNSSRSLDIFILSAEFGLIQAKKEIGAYDRLMTEARAEELRPIVLNTVRDLIAPKRYLEIFLSMGKTYLQALAGIEGLVDDETRVAASNEPLGRQLTELKRWLWGQEESLLTLELPWLDQEETNVAPAVSVPDVRPKTTPQSVTLRGEQIRMNTSEAISRLKQGMREDRVEVRKIRSWYVYIEGERISPKWAAQYLFGVHLSRFSADEARRALRGLGLNCYRI